MNTYQLQIKQLVDYPRCRIYREFIRKLMNDKNLRKTGGSYFFALLVLYSFGNFRSSYRRMDGISYLIGPGEWIFSLKELASCFRLKYQHQTKGQDILHCVSFPEIRVAPSILTDIYLRYFKFPMCRSTKKKSLSL